MANDPKPQEKTLSTLPIGGKLVDAMNANFTQPPVAGDESWETNSIGVALNSLVATDTNSAVVVGVDADVHQATIRSEVDVAAFRSKRTRQAVALDTLPRNLDKAGNPKVLPPVSALVRRRLAAMSLLARVDPDALLAIGKLAKAAGAFHVDLFQPKGQENELGFGFEFAPDPSHASLFNDWEGDVPVRGLFKTVESFADQREPSAPSADARPERRGSAVPSEPVGTGADAPSARETDPTPGTEPEPEPLVDLAESREREGYRLPPLSLLEVRLSESARVGGHEAEIVRQLRENNVPARVEAAHSGPRLTQYEVTVPANVKGSRIEGMASDFQRALGVHSVRIEAPIPGRKTIGIEVPNAVPRTVGLLDLCARAAFVDAAAPLTVALGEDVGGAPVYADLSETPHLLVAGATNSGKSIGIAGILASLLLRNTPKDLRLVLIDPKQVELTLFDRVPHLMCPVITDVKEAAGVLRAVWREMDRRYELLKEAGVRNLGGWNAKASFQDRMPHVVVVIDELADLMMSAGQEVESVVVRLAQKARAVGIHLVIATQRPSVDVVTGLIKANVPSRIAYAVASGVDSQVILDARGAERLLGKGDMLFAPIGAKPLRVQGAFVSEDEVAAVCRFWREQAAPSYEIRLDADGEPVKDEDGGPDPLFAEAVRWAAERGQASTSMLQRKFEVGFQRASRLLDAMEAAAVVGPRDGPRPREVLMARNEVEAMLAKEDGRGS